MSEDSAQQIETAAVLTAYGFNAKKDLLAQLLALNYFRFLSGMMSLDGRQLWRRWKP